MPDVFTAEKRSAVMARIRGSGNKATELRLIELFRANGITGWRRKSRLFGRPDFVFPRHPRRAVRGWLFLASAPRLQIYLHAKVSNGILVTEVREKRGS